MKKTSLFRKFTILILFAASLIVITTHISLYIHIASLRHKLPIYKGFSSLAHHIVSQLDISDTSAVRTYLSAQSLDLRYEGSFEWSSSKHVPSAKVAIEKSEGKSAFWHHNRLVSVVEKSNGTYVLMGIDPFDQLTFPWKIVLLWSGVLVLIFGLTHLKIRHYLKPVRILQDGVKQISNGNFSIQLPQTTSDELGQLVRSFNNMALQIRNDIKSRDQLLRDISHELRSPLSRMLLALEFLQEGNVRKTLKNNITILEKMTSTILEEERLDSPFGRVKREQIELRTVLTELIENRKECTPPVIMNEPERFDILADKERIKTALSNVIDNAIRYSKPDSEAVKVSCFKDEQYAVITIQDNGIGIPESELPFIFEPFYRIDKARRHNSGGYGLGMSLTKKIIEAHTGTITIESKPDSGTIVTIKIPL